MKIKNRFILLCIALLSSCREPGNQNSNERSIETGIDSSILQVNELDADTIKIGSFTFDIDIISRAEFTVAKVQGITYDTSEANNLERDASTVTRRGDTLFLKTFYGFATMVNNYSDNADSLAHYSYLGRLEETGHYLVHGEFYEWHNYILVSEKTGVETVMCGIPVLSPDRRYLISGNADLQAGYTFNGFELYKFENDRLSEIGIRELKSWGPLDIVWAKNDELLVERTEWDSNAESLEKTGYVSLKIMEE